MRQANDQSWLFSDGFLGTLVVLLTVLTAFASYQKALIGIEGDDLDFETQKALTLATTTFLDGNTEYLKDIQSYSSLRLFADLDQEEADFYLDQSSEALRAGLERPTGPFDDQYLEDRYGEAADLFAEVEKIEQQANEADDRARIYELAGLIFAIGLAATAWTVLVGSGRRIRLVFLLIALVSLVAGMAVVLKVVFV